MIKLRILNREEMECELNKTSQSITDFPEYAHGKYFIFSENDENPYITVIYDDLSVFTFGGKRDFPVCTVYDVLRTLDYFFDNE